MKDQKAIKETMPFTITTDRIKYLGINAPKEPGVLRFMGSQRVGTRLNN